MNESFNVIIQLPLLNTSGGTKGSFTGQLNGITPISGDVVPMQGRSAFRIRSDDAGRVLAAAGLLKQARDGTMELILTPAPEPGSYDGVLAIQQLRVREAPALAALLNSRTPRGEVVHSQEEQPVPLICGPPCSNTSVAYLSLDCEIEVRSATSTVWGGLLCA